MCFCSQTASAGSQGSHPAESNGRLSNCHSFNPYRGTGMQNIVNEMGIDMREFSWPDRWWIGKVSWRCTLRRLRHSSPAWTQAATKDVLTPHADMLMPAKLRAQAAVGCLQEGRMLEAHDTDAEIDQMHELFSSIFDEDYPVEDVSAAEWLKQKVRAPAARWCSPLGMRMASLCRLSIHAIPDPFGSLHQGATAKMLAAADACYANDWGKALFCICGFRTS